MGHNFGELSKAQWEASKFLCVGLDTDFEKIPESARVGGVRDSIVNFNQAIVDATKDIAGSYKPNSAFYEARGELGWSALQETITYIHEVAPKVPVILDAKRADIGNTNQGYVDAAFEHLDADAVTLHPYLGSEAMAPFLNRADAFVFVLCRTSNPGAGEFQDLIVGDPSNSLEVHEPLYLHVARTVSEKWNTHGNCGLVVGATFPEEMKKIRAVAGDLPFLIPGIGAQGGSIEQTVANGQDSRGMGMCIAAARSILYASSGEDFAEAARKEAQKLDAAIRAAL